MSIIFSLNKLGNNRIPRQLFIAMMFLLFFPLEGLFASSQDEEGFHRVWKGSEFIGFKEEEIDKIKEVIFVQSGTPFEEKKWLNLRRKCEKLNQIECAFLSIGGSDFYLIVEAKNLKETTAHFRRNAKNKQLLLHINLPIELERLADEWFDRTLILFKQGKGPKEFYKEGYLDAEDALLHDLAISLSKLVAKKNDVLLRVLLYSPNEIQRSKAATLLSWSKEEKNIAFVLEKNLLNDPSEGVRNDLARSMFFMFETIENYALKATALSTFCDQIAYPIMTDQNKGLRVIQSLIRNDSRLKRALIEDQSCKNRIIYLSQTSILPNVGGIATQILDEL